MICFSPRNNIPSPRRATEILGEGEGGASKGRQFPRGRGGSSRSFRIVKLLKTNSSSVEQAVISFTVNRRFKRRIV